MLSPDMSRADEKLTLLYNKHKRCHLGQVRHYLEQVHSSWNILLKELQREQNHFENCPTRPNEGKNHVHDVTRDTIGKIALRGSIISLK